MSVNAPKLWSRVKALRGASWAGRGAAVGAVGKERPGGRVKSSAKAASVVVVIGAAVVLLVWPLPLVLTRSLLAPLDSPPCWGLLRGGFALLPDPLLGNDLNLCLPPSTSVSSVLNLFRSSRASASLSSCSISLTAAFCWADRPVLSTKLEVLDVFSTFLLTVLRSASRASCLAGFLPAVAGFLKLTRTICSLEERKPLGWDTVPTAEVPWKGVLSSSSSSSS